MVSEGVIRKRQSYLEGTIRTSFFSHPLVALLLFYMHIYMPIYVYMYILTVELCGNGI